MLISGGRKSSQDGYQAAESIAGWLKQQEGCYWVECGKEGEKDACH